jgi:hypothetical protein
MATIAAVKAPNAQTTSSTTNDNRISLKAAFLALPECFMQAEGKVYVAPVKGQNCRPYYVSRFTLHVSRIPIAFSHPATTLARRSNTAHEETIDFRTGAPRIPPTRHPPRPGVGL